MARYLQERTSRIVGGRIVGQPGKNAHIYETVKQSGIGVFLDTYFFKYERFRINHNGKLSV